MKKFISFIAVAAATSLLCACGAERVQNGEPVTGTGAAAAAVNKGFLCCFRFRFCAGRCGSCPADAS